MESPPFVEKPDGDATIETYTVIFNREGAPEQGIIIGRLNGDSGARFFANAEPDADALVAMTREEFVGHPGRVSHDAETGKNVFVPS